MARILLTTLNSRYSHTSLGLRYLLANMGEELAAETALAEYTIHQRPSDILEQILAHSPQIVAFGIYIWNVSETEALVAQLKAVAPEVTVILGGPEVSYESESQRICALADYTIQGPGEGSLPTLCRRLLAGERPEGDIIPPAPLPLEQISLPYHHYSDVDIAQRILYVEASRGCPFKCEFCLSALDRTATPFDLDAFLEAMAELYDRGARRFKFVDRTFNLKVASCLQILDFFLERLDERLFLHFELIPDQLPDALKAKIRAFPPGALQFEIGIQSFNPQVQALISRRQDNEKTEENLRWLRRESHAHLHTDLILGLPGEDLASIAAGFDRLVTLAPHEIQVGILKRLRGAPIARHTEAYGMRYNPLPPYNILTTDRLDFATLQRLGRFARYWEILANHDRFPATLPLLLGDAPFERFLALSDWLYRETGQTHRLHLARQFTLLHRALTGPLGVPAEAVEAALRSDFAHNGLKGEPRFATP